MQHARPIGPTTNLQATFSTEMSAGSRPTSPRLFSARNRQGATLSQTTHVQATFAPNMTLALVPPQPRYLTRREGVSHQGRQWWTPDVDAFGVESVIGSKPYGSRYTLQQGAPSRQGHQVWVQDIAYFLPDKTLALMAPQSRYAMQQGSPFRQGVQWWTPEVEAFGIESVIGSHPDSPRYTLQQGAPSRQGQQLWSQDIAYFLPDKALALMTPRSRYAATSHQGQQAWNAEIDLFGVDSVEGWHPDKPRIVLGPRIPLPVSQPTHVSAPFSVDMAQGLGPAKQRYTAPEHRGAQWWTVEVLAFGVEMAIGSRPDRPRLTLGPKIALPVSQPMHTAATFSPEMAEGWHSDTSRAWIAPKRGSSLAQTTHTNAAITIDMLEGSHPARGLTKFPRLFTVCATPDSTAFAFEGIVGWTPTKPRYSAPEHHGWQIPDQTFLFSVEMAVGSHPDKNRAFIAPRLRQPESQFSHTSAAFSPEMVHGHLPAAKFRGYVPIKIGWNQVAFSTVRMNLHETETEALSGDRISRGLMATRWTVSLMSDSHSGNSSAVRTTTSLNPSRNTEPI